MMFSQEAIKQSLYKEITNITLIDEGDGALLLDFDIGASLKLYDDGRSCCEARYMTCDDPLDYFIGSNLFNIEVRYGDYKQSDYIHHEIQFLIITTSKGAFTIETHNEHNGYYGGFWIEAELIGENDLGESS